MLVLLFFVIQRFAVGVDLDFFFLAAGFDDRFVGDQFVVLGEGLDFDELARAGLGTKSFFHGGGKGIERDLLFNLDDIAIGVDENVFVVSAHGQFGFVVCLAFFFFLGESFDGRSLALGGDSLFDRGRQVGALDLLFLGKCDSAEGEDCDQGEFHGILQDSFQKDFLERHLKNKGGKSAGLPPLFFFHTTMNQVHTGVLKIR